MYFKRKYYCTLVTRILAEGNRTINIETLDETMLLKQTCIIFVSSSVSIHPVQPLSMFIIGETEIACVIK